MHTDLLIRLIGLLKGRKTNLWFFLNSGFYKCEILLLRRIPLMEIHIVLRNIIRIETTIVDEKVVFTEVLLFQLCERS